VLTLEDDIARAVAVDLHASLFNIAAPVTPSTRSLEAYRLLLQAEHLWQQDAATEDERVLIETALQKDPAYANAWVDLGYWWYDAMLYGKADTETALRNSRAAHERALALDKNSVGAHLGLAWLQMSQLDWTGAQRNIDRAGLLDPASLPLLTVRGEMARSAGRWGEAIRYEHERLQRDPLSVGAQFVLAESLLCAGEYQNAAEILGSTVTENPRYPGAHALLGRAIAAQGNATMALRFIDVEPDESMHLAGLAGVQFDLGNAKASDEALSQLKSQYGRTLPGLVGLAYAHRRELEPAFQWLQQAVDQRQAEFAANLACTPEPAFSALRADPRFAALRSSLGLNR
jgi:Tfp pilus assembly protein PilF